MKRMNINENEVRTIISVFGELKKLPYEELNKHLGSLTIEEMDETYLKLYKWYQSNILGNVHDPEYG